MRSLVALLAVFSAMADAAALRPVPGTAPLHVVTGFEPNRGQSGPNVLFVARGERALAVSAQSIMLPAYDQRISLHSSQPNPRLTFSDPLHGVVHSYTGADASQWLRDIPVYATVTLEGVYPGVDAQYRMDREGAVVLAFLVGPGVNLEDISVHSQRFSFPAPVAFQAGVAGLIPREASLVARGMGFGFAVQDYDPAIPLEISFTLRPASAAEVAPRLFQVADGSTFAAAELPEAPGKAGVACRDSGGRPALCSDVAVYKLTPQGDLEFAAYLAGEGFESVFFAGPSPDGAVVVAGGTGSADFPITQNATQVQYAGPDRSREDGAGDYFVAKINAGSGALTASTFLGGPYGDYDGEASVGPDGSVYLSGFAEGLTAFPQLSPCGEAYGCRQFFAVRLSPWLDEMIFGIYLPGMGRAQAHSDGSLYFVGTGGSEFTPTLGAYQPEAASPEDAIFGRLDPSGGLVFATFVGDEGRNSIHELEVLGDGSVWGAVPSYDSEQGRGATRFVRVDAEGRRLLADYVSGPSYGETLTTDPEGNLIVLASGLSPVTPNALVSSACMSDGRAYLRIGLTGELLFSTYLPEGAFHTFVGVSERGFPVLGLTQSYFPAPGQGSKVREWNAEIVEDEAAGPFVGCTVSSATYQNTSAVSPGEIITIFGSGMGPASGVSFTLEEGRLPTSLAGTRVLVNGEPVPLLFVSHWQINAILPYSLEYSTRIPTQVEVNGEAVSTFRMDLVERISLALFRLNGEDRAAAALNEDGTVNSPANPARPGSVVTFFGTGGGQTTPRSGAGEITPLALRPLDAAVYAEVSRVPATVLYAGAAPGLVAGAIQINVQLPEQIQPSSGLPAGIVSVRVNERPVWVAGDYVTIAVAPD